MGCAELIKHLHVYVELVAADAAAEVSYPGIAAHLKACGPCSEDFTGMLTAIIGPAPGTTRTEGTP